MNYTVDKHRWRELLLAVTGIGIGAIAVLSFILPTIGNQPVSSFTFPPRLPLNSWEQKAYRSLKPSKSLAASSYHYTQNQLALGVEIRYIVGTRGDVKSYIARYTEIDERDIANEKIARIENIGYHYLFTSGDRAYLSSCISPRSQSSVTPTQFSLNRYRHDLNLQVWWNWLWGEASIRDRRCLWTHLSLAIEDSNIQTAYKTLETAWIDWYRWWQPRFPSL